MPENYKMDILTNEIIYCRCGEVTIKGKLGKGKSGVSYLAELNGQEVVYKIMHDEPCPYYTFSGNKVALEVNSYKVLNECGILIPELICFDEEKNYLIKSFIDGKCGHTWVAEGNDDDKIIEQLFSVYKKVKIKEINIDYFPANFVISHNLLYYIDFEINKYDYLWGLEEWGIYYWANRQGMADYIKNGSWKGINENENSGIPIKIPFEKKVSVWKNKFNNIY